MVGNAVGLQPESPNFQSGMSETKRVFSLSLSIFLSSSLLFFEQKKDNQHDIEKEKSLSVSIQTRSQNFLVGGARHHFGRGTLEKSVRCPFTG
jgi:hypothetical protein